MESASQSRQADKAKPLISIKDIAKEAGVSICTVSLVLNNKDRNRVSKAVAQRVRETAQSMGYKPNSVARTLRTSRSYALGFITDEIATTPYAGRVLVGAQEAARKLGYILLTVNTGNDRELENQEIAALRQYRVDGFLYAMMYHRVVKIPAELEGSPMVVVDSEDENRKIPSIYPDDEMAGYDATNRLIQAGCKRIVYYGSSITIIAQNLLRNGYAREDISLTNVFAVPMEYMADFDAADTLGVYLTADFASADAQAIVCLLYQHHSTGIEYCVLPMNSRMTVSLDRASDQARDFMMYSTILLAAVSIGLIGSMLTCWSKRKKEYAVLSCLGVPETTLAFESVMEMVIPFLLSGVIGAVLGAIASPHITVGEVAVHGNIQAIAAPILFATVAGALLSLILLHQQRHVVLAAVLRYNE